VLGAVVENMPQGSKDMLANRRATMATSKTGPVSRVEEVSATPSRAKATGSATPARAAGSPALTAQRQMASPATRLPRPGGSIANSPAVGRSGSASASTSSSSTAARAPVPPGSPSRSQLPGLARPVIQAPSSRLQKMSDPFASTAPRASMMPLARHAPPPPKAPSPPPPFDAISAAINNIRQEDPNQGIEALKHLQGLLAETPQHFEDCVGTLLDVLLDELDRVFTPPEQVHERDNFRMVKHLVQAFSGIACTQSLIRKLNVDSLYSLLYAVTHRMISCDRLGGEVVGLARFMNLIIIQALSTPDRYIVYKAMFRLLHDLTKNFVIDQVQPTDEIAAHADLVLKCLWKRCKIIDEDLKSGKVEAGKLLRILEDFLDSIGPTEWTRRGKNGVPLGVLPLRTVKTVLQRTMGESSLRARADGVAYATESDQEIYDILTAEFGDKASDTIVSLPI
jgi:cytoskeleton-associated protein 5